MILKNPEITITPENPFENDGLNRKDSAVALTQFVLSAEEPLVVCIDAPWGEGKTTFLRMWKQHLKNELIPVIYFSAWENDFTDDALIALIGEIGSAIDEISENGDPKKAKQFFDQAKKIGIALLKKSVPVAAKIATAGALDLDKVTEQALASFAETLAKEEFAKYEKSKKTLETFKSTLSNLANSISSNDEPKPLVFIIDELDRCRPTFAIELLEKAKHLFNVNNIIFILGADKVQLGHSIKAVYGNELDTNGYLRRFIDFDYLLSPPEQGLFVDMLFKKFSFQNNFFAKNKYHSYEGEQALEMFKKLFEIYKLTLREQEHCCSLLSLVIRTTNADGTLFPHFICFFIVLKIKTPDIYKKIIFNKLNFEQIMDYLSNQNGSTELLESNSGILLEAYILLYKHSLQGNDSNLISRYQELADSIHEDKTKTQRAQSLMRTISSLGIHKSSYLKSMVNSIEVVSQFKPKY
ncbi:MAG: hypothetical protein GY710_08670 [Desulfobacteraceae bacterium]|nr:hypothetical protein [Desulfobacteraceae bacterium]